MTEPQSKKELSERTTLLATEVMATMKELGFVMVFVREDAEGDETYWIHTNLNTEGVAQAAANVLEMTLRVRAGDMEGINSWATQVPSAETEN